MELTERAACSIRAPERARGCPEETHLTADVIGIDIVGFSTFTEALIAEKGDGAAEELCDLLNLGFGAADALLLREGFCVADTLGDGLLSFRRGSLDADQLNRLSDDVETAFSQAAPRHRARAVWGKGTLSIYRVGGWQGQWHTLATGPAVEAVHGAFLARKAAGRATPARPDFALAQPTQSSRDPDHAALRNAEVRWLTMLFAQFTPDPRQAVSLERLQALVVTSQRLADACGGHLEKVTHDDKGLLLNMSFTDAREIGSTSFDSAASCVRLLEAERESLGLPLCFGMSEGFVYRGPINLAASTVATIHGPSVNTAAKLTCIAGGRLNVRAVQTVNVRERLAKHGFRGYSQMTSLGDVLCLEATSASRADVQSRAAQLLAGRGNELQQMLSAFDSPQRDASIFSLIGPAGIGKSMLLSAFHRRISAPSFSILTVCDPRHVDDPFFLWRDVLIKLVETAGTDPADRLSWVSNALAAAGIAEEQWGVVNDLVPGIAAYSETVASLRGPARRHVIERSITALLRHAAAARQVHIGVDDAQWLDAASLHILRQAANLTSHLFIVLAYRDEFHAHEDHLKGFAARQPVRSLELSPLTRADFDIMFASSALRIDGRGIDRLFELSGGNPFYAEQIAHWLSAGGDAAAFDDDHTQALSPAVRASGLLGRVLDSRLDRLTEQETRIVRFLAVLDRPTTIQDLETIDETPLADPQVLDDLSRKAVVDDTVRGPDSVRAFRLKHRLLTDAIAMRIPPSQLRRLHRKSARMLGRRRRNGDGTIGPALLAQHWRDAGEKARAAVCFGAAADAALDSAADAQALSLYDSAIKMIGEGSDRVAPPRVAAWFAGKATACWSLGRLRLTAEYIARGLAILDAGLGGPAWVPRALAGRLAQLRRLALPLVGLGDVALPRASRAPLLRLSLVRGETAIHFGDAGGFASASATLLALSPDSHLRNATRAQSYNLLAYVSGTSVLTRPLSRIALRAARRAAGDPAVDGRPFARISGAEALLFCMRGEWAEAHEKLCEAVSYASHPRDPQALEFAEVCFAVSAYFQGSWEESVNRFRALYDAAHARDCALHQGWGLYGQAEALLIPARLAEAEALLAAAEPIIADQQERQSAVICAGLRAQLHFAKREYGLALQWATEALKIATVLPCNNYTSLEGYAAGAEVTLRACLDDSVPADVREAARSIAQASLRPLRRFARTFPIGRPRLALCRGLAAHLAGREQEAQRVLRIGLAQARSMAMAYERQKLEDALHKAEGERHAAAELR